MRTSHRRRANEKKYDIDLARVLVVAFVEHTQTKQVLQPVVAPIPGE